MEGEKEQDLNTDISEAVDSDGWKEGNGEENRFLSTIRFLLKFREKLFVKHEIRN